MRVSSPSSAFAALRRPDAVNTSEVNVQGLLQVLRQRVRGDVLFDDGSRAIYSTDASNYRQIPIGVVVPRDADDVVATVAACRAFGAPVLSRGGGTSLAGQACNVAVVMDMSKYMNGVVHIDWENKQARVQPGTVLDALRDAAEERNLTFGPDPATHNRSTLGGMIGNNSCGMHAQMAGKVEANIDELEILTYGGLRMRVGQTSEEDLEKIIASGGRRAEIYARLKTLRDRYADRIRARYPDIPRRVSGYNLNELLPENGFHVARALVGSESTCVTVLEATCRLVHSPACRALLLLGFADIFTAADHVPFCNEHGPIALEGLDASMFRYMNDKGMSTAGRAMFPDGSAWLVVEFGGETTGEAEARAKALVEAYASHPDPPRAKLFSDNHHMRQLWDIRESGLGSTSKVPGQPDFWPGWEDSAVAPERLGAYLRKLQVLFETYDYHCSLYGHFGQGCVHCSIDFDLVTAHGIARWRDFMKEAAALVCEFGGSLSGEHGDGQARAEFLPIMYGPDLVKAFAEFKNIWDPRGKMNPGKIVDPLAIDQNLRLGVHYDPWDPITHFAFGSDRGSFAYAANRCVGTGRCRKHDGGTMCPSYMVTRDEKDSTRGRARALFEMLEGEPLGDRWRDEAVKEALDLCLSCKGCKGECPVAVDMATYKAEFLSHYYEGRVRPVAAYAFGLMYWWATIASRMPSVVNFLTQTPLLRDVVKALATMAPQRRVPVFALRTFRRWFDTRGLRNQGKAKVILWVDTWNNHFHPTTAQAAVEVLEAAGFQVVIPKSPLCCGRPLYDYGMLDLAKTMLGRVLEELRPDIRAGACVVGLEPSCVSVFREEMAELMPGDRDADALKRQTFMLSEFLVQKAAHFELPRLERKALVHGHCHHKSVLRMADEEALLARMGLDYTMVDSGCCGMAGSFGFEKGDHYDVSIKAGERVLLPAVRAASDDTLIINDGFSCREQIAQTTDRQAMHLAEVIKMAMDHGPAGVPSPLPERESSFARGRQGRRGSRRGLAAIALLLAVGAAAVALGKRRAK
ncbi:MAG: FAD-binding oxidoreductase [Candidatus Eremiobacteraeota bacterium]|nr:FAD-binding oxidoreductase [Candidatus Eremiobacteraeota bacterium]MBC5827301.1 FAD-binding oxidoreductase [Candidatus Eremiobacteraeota bacterium]